MEALKERLKNVPLQPGVYLYKDAEGRVIYVGKARSLRSRMRSYFQSPDRLLPKVRAMVARIHDFDYIVTSTEVEALILENNLIKSYQPRYNILLRDDKSYPYLKITGEDFPRICMVREKKDQVSHYYGPYTEAATLRDTIRLLTSIFPLRTCKNLRTRSRPCLNYDMGKCLAPCVGRVSQEEYAQVVEELINFLEGRNDKLLEKKEAQMHQAAEELEFEKAARLRDQIEAIKILGVKQQVAFARPYQLDAIAMIKGERSSLVLVFKLREGNIVARDTFWLQQGIDEDKSELLAFFLKRFYAEQQDLPREIIVEHEPADQALVEEWLADKAGHKVPIRIPQRGEKRSILEMVLENANILWQEHSREDREARAALHRLADLLALEVLPERIECYDVSHYGGKETVASMVVFTAGNADKKAYRRFKLAEDQNDDYASMREVLQRRFKEALHNNPAFLPEPDLILVDGGLGQVNAVQQVLEEMQVDIPVIGLAEKKEEIYRPHFPLPLQLPRRDEGLKLLQRIRDEAHRFALAYQRQRRGQTLFRSQLDDIPGIGPARKKALLEHFGSVSAIRNASEEELVAVPGMNRPAARAVLAYFTAADYGQGEQLGPKSEV
ncbi:MAG TPA: excinuclease ABC subunit UvrC [Syntrophomonadaceae bacterium]|jgi:excinuclease ABC subunit C|nr:excinuclease ABC subunit UvrC [Syntrophomonadaceae bacterium]